MQRGIKRKGDCILATRQLGGGQFARAILQAFQTAAGNTQEIEIRVVWRQLADQPCYDDGGLDVLATGTGHAPHFKNMRNNNRAAIPPHGCLAQAFHRQHSVTGSLNHLLPGGGNGVGADQDIFQFIGKIDGLGWRATSAIVHR